MITEQTDLMSFFYCFRHVSLVSTAPASCLKMSMGELSYSSIKTASQAKEADEVRAEARKKVSAFQM